MGNKQSFLFCWLQYCVSYHKNICSCISYIITCGIGYDRTWMVLEQPAPVEASLPMGRELGTG